MADVILTTEFEEGKSNKKEAMNEIKKIQLNRSLAVAKRLQKMIVMMKVYWLLWHQYQCTENNLFDGFLNFG